MVPPSKIVALPLAQETSDVPCDTGRDVVDLTAAFVNAPVDFGNVCHGWDSKTGKWAPEDAAVERRLAELKCFLADYPGTECVLVTHGYFIRYLTNDWTNLEINGKCRYTRLSQNAAVSLMQL